MRFVVHRLCHICHLVLSPSSVSSFFINSFKMTTPVDVTSWVQTIGEKNCVSAQKVHFSQTGGLSADMFLLNAKYEDGSETTRVMKTFVGEKQLDKSKMLGLAREGELLARCKQTDENSSESNIHKVLCKMIPKVSYADGNPETGEKMILMEKIAGYETGKLFPNSQSTWETPDEELEKMRRDFYSLKKLTSEPVDLAVVREVCEDAFRKAANLHAVSWMEEELLQPEFWSRVLRHGSWMSPKIKKEEDASNLTADEVDVSWKKSMDWATESWASLPSMESPPTISPLLRECVEKSLSKINFSEYRKMFFNDEAPEKQIPWCLAHGDFYPGNVLLEEETGKSLLVDFEMTCIGSGPQDLGQYMISHCPPEMRRKLEKELVCEVYYKELCARLEEYGKPVPEVSAVWEEYKFGGAGRWVWFVCVLMPLLSGAPRLLQFFCDQLTEFLRDHFISDTDSICQPRI